MLNIKVFCVFVNEGHVDIYILDLWSKSYSSYKEKKGILLLVLFVHSILF